MGGRVFMRWIIAALLVIAEQPELALLVLALSYLWDK